MSTKCKDPREEKTQLSLTRFPKILLQEYFLITGSSRTLGVGGGHRHSLVSRTV